MPVFATCPKVAANPDAGREDPHKMMQRLIKHGFPIHTAASKWNRDKCHEVFTKHAFMLSLPSGI